MQEALSVCSDRRTMRRLTPNVLFLMRECAVSSGSGSLTARLNYSSITA